MRVFFLVITYILFAENALAQRIALQKAIVELENRDFLYLGVKNRFSVSIPEVAPENIVVSATNGILEKECLICYSFTPEEKQRGTLIKIGIKNATNIIWVDSAEYRFRKVPPPSTLFGTKSNGKISKKELLNATLINCGLGEGFAYEGLKFEVKSFSIKMIYNESVYSENVVGRKITSSIKSQLEKLQVGDMVIVYDIEAEHNGKLSKALPVVLTIKE